MSDNLDVLGSKLDVCSVHGVCDVCRDVVFGVFVLICCLVSMVCAVNSLNVVNVIDFGNWWCGKLYVMNLCMATSKCKVTSIK